jgi:hypothetical protein
MEVPAVTFFFLVNSSSCGISLQNTAVDAPEVISLISLDAICEEEERALA